MTSAGGRFVALDAITQAKLWSSDLLGEGTVVGFADLYGDGKTVVVVQTEQQAHVLDGATGQLKWSSNASDIQLMGAVRIRDMNGDGHPDLYLDNAIGAKPGTTLDAVYSFSTGTPAKLWSLPLTITPQSINSGTDSLVDLDQDGVPEVVLPSWDSALLVKGSDGSTICTLSQALGATHPFPQSSALAAQVDGTPNQELVVVTPGSSAGSQTVPTISVFQVDPSSGTSASLWTIGTGSYDSEMSYNGDLATDLDGDGLSEVVFSVRIGATWTTEVHDGATGNIVASVPDSRFEGATDLDGQPGAELIVATATGVSAYRLAGNTLSPVATELQGVRTLALSDPSLKNSSPFHQRVAVVTGPGGKPMLLVGTPSGSPAPLGAIGAFSSVQGVELDASGHWVSQGSYTPIAGVVTGAMRADHATRPYDQVALGTSGGLVAVLNRHLVPTNGFLWLNGAGLGAFVGGSRRGVPLLSAADALGPFVVFPSTFLGAVVADARFASWIVPPVPRWANTSLLGPSVVDLNGTLSIVGVEGQDAVARRTDTGVVTSTVTMPAGHIWSAPLPLHAAGVANTRVGIDWRVDGSQVSQTAVDFASQSVLWSGAPVSLGGYFGSSAADVDGDGTDEWYSLVTSLYQRNTLTGVASLYGSFPSFGYSMPMIASFLPGSKQLLLQAGGQGPKLAHSDATLLWEGSSSEAVNTMLGAKAQCATAPVFITPAFASPLVQAYDATTGTKLASRVLAGGHSYASYQAATVAGDTPGTLSNVSAVADLAGSPAVLTGSSDGYLYALDPCTLDIRWAANIGVPVGEPIVADDDGDGDDEIIVPAANGFVYGLDKAAYDAPTLAFAGDGGGSQISIQPGASVSVSWQSVAGATGYELALVGPDEKAINNPAYQDVAGTSSTVSLDGGLAGRPYHISVRAKGSAGVGKETISKSIVIADVTPPAATVDAAGGSSVTLTVGAADDVGLDHFEVVLNPGAQAHFIDDVFLAGKSEHQAFTWTPEPSTWGTDVTLQVNVFDSAGLHSETTVAVHVNADGSVTTGTPISQPQGNPPGPTNPGGDTTTPQTNAELAGCGCNVASDSKSSSFWFLALGAAGIAVARRRR